MSTLQPTITAAELDAMLRDPDVPDSAIRPWLMVDAAQSSAFHPVVAAAAGRVEGPGGGALESAFALAQFNTIARWRRRRRYEARIAGGWTGLRMVAEGDSWFQFPFLIDDVIDQLSHGAAILCLSGAGHLVREMLDQGELVPVVVAQQPDLILLSGGGNDLLGDGRLAGAINAFSAGEPADWYLGDGFARTLDDVIDAWAEQLRRVRAVAPDTPILAHSYGHAIPAAGRWLGGPLARRGIVDPALQRAIVAAMIDAFHERLGALFASVGNAVVADCRAVVADPLWQDELHPNSDGFACVASVMASHIRALTGRPFPAIAVNILESAGTNAASGETAAGADGGGAGDR
jgi:lysophospholipase L1-like esterase